MSPVHSIHSKLDFFLWGSQWFSLFVPLGPQGELWSLTIILWFWYLPLATIAANIRWLVVLPVELCLLAPRRWRNIWTSRGKEEVSEEQKTLFEKDTAHGMLGQFHQCVLSSFGLISSEVKQNNHHFLNEILKSYFYSACCLCFSLFWCLLNGLMFLQVSSSGMLGP